MKHTHTHKHLSLYDSALILQLVCKAWCSLFKYPQQLWTRFSPSAHFLFENLVSTSKWFNIKRKQVEEVGKGPEDWQRNGKDNWRLKLLIVHHSSSYYSYICTLASLKYLSVYKVDTRGCTWKLQNWQIPISNSWCPSPFSPLLHIACEMVSMNKSPHSWLFVSPTHP